MNLGNLFRSREDELREEIAKLGEKIYESAELFLKLAQHDGDSIRIGKRIKEIENEADGISSKIRYLIDQTSDANLKYDGSDYAEVREYADNIVDNIEGASNRIVFIFRLGDAHKELLEIAKILFHLATRLKRLLADLKGLEKRRSLSEVTIHFDEEEDRADALRAKALENLYSKSKKLTPLELENLPDLIFAWPQVYEHVENAVDEATHLAHTLNNMALRY